VVARKCTGKTKNVIGKGEVAPQAGRNVKEVSRKGDRVIRRRVASKRGSLGAMVPR